MSLRNLSRGCRLRVDADETEGEETRIQVPGRGAQWRAPGANAQPEHPGNTLAVAVDPVASGLQGGLAIRGAGDPVQIADLPPTGFWVAGTRGQDNDSRKPSPAAGPGL
ncbi:MAG: hypothetical protein GY842_18305 [bacterium]|nr:hypothetical protein [bacterium]